MFSAASLSFAVATLFSYDPSYPVNDFQPLSILFYPEQVPTRLSAILPPDRKLVLRLPATTEPNGVWTVKGQAADFVTNTQEGLYPLMSSLNADPSKEIIPFITPATQVMTFPVLPTGNHTYALEYGVRNGQRAVYTVILEVNVQEAPRGLRLNTPLAKGCH